jgi:hypothetical protein
MASAAFPGVFNNVTLRNFYWPNKDDARKRYLHLFDGGPVDNLGVLTLLDTLVKLYDPERPRKPRGCLLFIVDAHGFSQPAREESSTLKRDTRSFVDHIVDLNALVASDSMLTRRRFEILRRVGFTVRETYETSFRDFPIFPDRTDSPRCGAWHLSLTNLFEAKQLKLEEPDLASRVGVAVNNIPTQFKLTVPSAEWKELGRKYRIELPEPSAENIQGLLFAAAALLVRGDRQTLTQVCRWFGALGFDDRRCRKGVEEGVGH